MPPTGALAEATVQDLQLELIRRTRFNTFDGEQVCELLARHHGLWRSVLLDRPGMPDHRHPHRLPVCGLIKLRDLEHDVWNADTLFVRTHTVDGPRQLAAAFEQAEVGAMPTVHDDQDEVNMAMGMGPQEIGLLSVWWD